MGFGIGVLLYVVVRFVPGIVARLLGSEDIRMVTLAALTGLAVSLLYLGPILYAGIRNSRVSRERYRVARDWWDVMTRPWGFVAAVAVAIGLFPVDGLVHDIGTLFFGCLLAAMALVTVPVVIATSGEIDPDELTFRYQGVDEYDLTYLREMKRISLGRHTFILLLFARDYHDRRSAQDIYVLPTEVANRAASVFQSGIAADIGTPKEHGRLRRVNVFVVSSGLFLMAAPLASFVWIDASPYLYLQWLYGSLFFVFILFRALVKAL